MNQSELSVFIVNKNYRWISAWISVSFHAVCIYSETVCKKKWIWRW